MISLKHLDLFAHRSGVADRSLAEREVLLTYALQAIYQAGLGEKLAFKGGTCLRKTVFGEDGRFSEDLDFTLRVGFDRDDVAQEVLEFFEGEHLAVRYAVADWYVTHESFGGQITYSHEHTAAGAFKLDISFRELPTLEVRPREQIEQSYFRYLEFVPVALPTLHTLELVAEKVRATFQRSKVRDLFDLYSYLRGGGTPVPLLRALVVLKLWQSKDPFDPSVLFQRFRDGRYDWDDLYRLVRPGRVPKQDDVLRVVQAELANLHDLTDVERQLVANAKQGHNEALAEKLRAEVVILAAAL